MSENANWTERREAREAARARRLAEREVRRSRGESDKSAAAAGSAAASQILETPTVTPLADASVVPDTRGNAMDISQWCYPEYDYSRDDVTPMPSVKFQTYAGDPAMHYEWPDTDSGEYYRVVVSDEVLPDDPDGYDTIGVTNKPYITDNRPPSGPYRHVTVWGYEYDEARPGHLGQCRLVASGTYVFPVSNWALDYSESVVLSNWKVERAATGSGAKVEVLYARIDSGENVRKLIKSGMWLGKVVPSDGTGFLNGFSDENVIQGESYTYVCAVQVTFADGATHLSKALQKPIIIDADIAPKVTDLNVSAEAGSEGNFCRIVWTQPSVGDVRVFRLQEEPDREALAAAQVPSQALEKIGLNSSTVLNIPASPMRGEDANGRFEISKAAWPDGEGWDRVTFVPVTFLNDMAAIGTPVTMRRTGVLDCVKVVQRMHWQVVTFRWPGDALQVELRIGASTDGIDSESEPNYVVERGDYKNSGGFVIPFPGLPAAGGVLQLRAVSHYGGRKFYSEPVYHEVGALWQYSYSIAWPLLSRGLLGRFVNRPLEITVTPHRQKVRTDVALTFVVVHNSEHLPIHLHDGQQLEIHLNPPDDINAKVVQQFGVQPNGATKVWVNYLEQGVRSGYVRVFPVAEAQVKYPAEQAAYALERIALEGPALNDLRVK